MNAPIPGEKLYRPRLMTLLHTALAVGETRYARRIALAWLASYPGDLPVSMLNAQALLDENHPKQAVELLEKICQVDVEYLKAFEILDEAQQKANLERSADLTGIIYALGGSLPSSEQVPDWAVHLRGARQARRLGFLDRAHDLILRAQVDKSDCCQIAVSHLQILADRATTTLTNPGEHGAVLTQTTNLPTTLAIRSMADAYRDRWPSCLQLSLLLAQSLIDCNDDEAAVSLIHFSVAQDVTGQVATRLWGANHLYRTLWPNNLSIQHDQPVPAAVAASLGWNQLPRTIIPLQRGGYRGIPLHKGETFTYNKKTQKQDNSSQQVAHSSLFSTETLRSVQEELNRLASRLNQPTLAQNDGRFPIYVIFTTQSGLVNQYGSVGAATIEVEMKRIIQATRLGKHWGATLFYADQGGYGILPTKPTDPWGLKLALADLDNALAQRGERIGAVLIVGGPQVVPFHHLPNPVDDADIDVPSDNPYATRDENYFIPEWPVGRIPGDATNDTTPLVTALREISTIREKQNHHHKWYIRSWMKIINFIRQHKVTRHPSLGYTAAIWRRASLAVFRPVGDGHSLHVSPPVKSVNGKRWAVGSLGYFNLHGLIDAVEWFGQRDPTEPSSEPDYPVVLRPSDVVNNGRSPKVVFSEACFGTYIYDRSIEQALSLKFLASGSHAVVGSTCTSYGSVTMPLIAADLLGRAFWMYLRDGCPAGEALRRAKVSLASEMNNRQGYLDGEDQKTLISFVLYGDPLTQLSGKALTGESIFLRSSSTPTHPFTVCDRYDQSCGSSPSPIPPETLTQVKSIVAQYLPGMSDAQLILSHERVECHSSDHICPTSISGSKTSLKHLPMHQTVVLSKSIQQADYQHNQYARLTLDESGKLLKLAISR